jgi:hypothetical protein
MTPEQKKALALSRARRRRAEAESIQPVQEVQPVEEPSFASRVGEKLDVRRGNVTDLMEGLARSTNEDVLDPNRIGLPSFLLQTVGQTAGGALDIVGEGLSSVGRFGAEKLTEAFPEKARSLRGGMAALRSMEMPFQSPATRKAEETAKAGIQKASELAQKYPKQAGELGAVANILSVAAPFKDAGQRSMGKQLAKRKEFVDDLILKNTTPLQKRDIVERSVQVGKKVRVNLTPRENAISNEVSKLKGVKPKNTLLQNQNVIQSEIDKTLKALDKRLAGSKVRINRQGMNSYIETNVNKALEANKLTPTVGKKALKDFTDLGKELLAKHPNTPSGILKARREFDRLVKKAKPTVSHTELEKPFDDLVHTVRSSMNDLVAESAPEAGVKAALKKSSHLISAVEAIVPKTTKDLTQKSTSKLVRGAESLARFSILAKTSHMVRK